MKKRSLGKYQKGGTTKSSSQRAPIAVTDLNDSGLRAYNDSNALYQTNVLIPSSGYVRKPFRNSMTNGITSGNNVTTISPERMFKKGEIKPIAQWEDKAVLDYDTQIREWARNGGHGQPPVPPVKEKLHVNNSRETHPFVTTYFEFKKPVQPYILTPPVSQPIVPTIPTYNTPQQMYQGREFMETTGLQPGNYHPEEVQAALANQTAKGKRAFANGGMMQYQKGGFVNSIQDYNAKYGNTYPVARKLPNTNIQTNVNTNPIVPRGNVNDVPTYNGKKNYIRPEETLSPAEEKSLLSKIGEHLENPLPSNTGERNPYNYALDLINPVFYGKAIDNTVGNLIHPVQTAKNLANLGLGVAGTVVGDNQTTDMAPGIQNIMDAALVSQIPKSFRTALKTYDRNFNAIGKELAAIEQEGVRQGLSNHEIQKLQMEKVGITSNQREAYRPIASNIAEKYITPYGYAGMEGENKLQQTINNIKQGGLKNKKINLDKDIVGPFDRTEISPERSDAWRLYLGKPQEHNTFRIAETSPINHPSYNSKQLANTDIYSINSEYAKLGIKPNIGYPELVSPSRIQSNMNLLRNKINIDTGNEIMGGYNKRLSQHGLEYNDIWDLQPSIVPTNYLPSALKNTLGESALFTKILPNKVQVPRSFKIDTSRILGKPFMSHEVLPYTSNDLTREMNNVFDYQIQNLKESSYDMTPKIEKMKAYKEELKNYPKYAKGGIIQDDKGQWAHPGEITKINSNRITMKGVNYPVMGIDNLGNKQMMMPNGEYKFDGTNVTEYPIIENNMNEYKKGGSIHIKPSHRGLLHKNLGVPAGEKIPASKLVVHEGDSTAVKKRKIFAQNAKKWHHADGGLIQYQLGGNTSAATVGTNFGGVAQLGSMAGNVLLSAIPDKTYNDANGQPIGTVESKGEAIGKGALKGAAAGAMLGPIGAGVGAVIGGGLGYINQRHDEKELQKTQKLLNNNITTKSRLGGPNSTVNNVTTNNSDMYAHGGVVTDDQPGATAELELQEQMQLPDGTVMGVDGPSHENGGIEVNAPEGTRVFSDRLKLGNKTFASRAKSINNKIAALDRKPSNSASENTEMLFNKQLDNLFNAQEGLKQQEEMKTRKTLFANGGTIPAERNGMIPATNVNIMRMGGLTQYGLAGLVNTGDPNKLLQNLFNPKEETNYFTPENMAFGAQGINNIAQNQIIDSLARPGVQKYAALTPGDAPDHVNYSNERSAISGAAAAARRGISLGSRSYSTQDANYQKLRNDELMNQGRSFQTEHNVNTQLDNAYKQQKAAVYNQNAQMNAATDMYNMENQYNYNLWKTGNKLKAAGSAGDQITNVFNNQTNRNSQMEYYKVLANAYSKSNGTGANISDQTVKGSKLEGKQRYGGTIKRSIRR